MSDDQFAELVGRSAAWIDVARGLGYQAGPDGPQAKRWRRRCDRLGVSHAHLDGRGRNGHVAITAPATPFTSPSTEKFLRRAAASAATAWFAVRGYHVSVPVEPAPYDLVVDVDGQFYRIQVKSTSTDRHIVALDSTRYRKELGRSIQLPYEDGLFDYWFIVSGDGTMYLLPFGVLAGKSQVNLARRYAEFVVN